MKQVVLQRLIYLDFWSCVFLKIYIKNITFQVYDVEISLLVLLDISLTCS